MDPHNPLVRDVSHLQQRADDTMKELTEQKVVLSSISTKVRSVDTRLTNIEAKVDQLVRDNARMQGGLKSWHVAAGLLLAVVAAVSSVVPLFL